MINEHKHDKFQFKLNDANKILSFLNIAYQDYISSRILFNSYKLLQACFLANTSIEKLFKSIILINNVKPRRIHDLTQLYDKIIQFDSNLKGKINYEFIQELTKIYYCRYLSDLEIDYNIVIIKRKYLAELDYIFDTLNSILEFSISGEIIKSKYLLNKEERSIELLKENYLLNGIDKTEYIEQLDSIFELRVHKNGIIYEVLYPTLESKNNSKFDYTALKPDKQSVGRFKMSHTLMENPIVRTKEGLKYINDLNYNK